MSEPIKIVDKLTLRQESLRLAVATETDYPISEAKKFEAYLLNDADSTTAPIKVISNTYREKK